MRPAAPAILLSALFGGWLNKAPALSTAKQQPPQKITEEAGRAKDPAKLSESSPAAKKPRQKKSSRRSRKKPPMRRPKRPPPCKRRRLCG